MKAFRQNIDMYIAEKDITIREVAEVADISFDTLKTFIYGDAKDCKLSTAVKLARAFGVSLEELVGAETVLPQARECMGMYRNLPDNDKFLVYWFVSYLTKLNENKSENTYSISVMELECNHHGNLKITTNYRKVDITHLHEEYRRKIFFGVTLPCSHYMPKYNPYNVLLIANDRNSKNEENVLIQLDNSLYIAKRKYEDGVGKYYSIRDGKYRMDEDKVDQVVGYIVGALSPDGKFISE